MSVAKVAAAIGLLYLAACDQASQTAESGASEKIERGQVALVAEAPDGTKLWGISPPGASRRVYFASSGAITSHPERCGKNCTTEVDDVVPTADPLAAAARDWSRK